MEVLLYKLNNKHYKNVNTPTGTAPEYESRVFG